MDLISQGENIHAASGGKPFDAGKPCIVFLHGAGMDHTVWALQTRYFAHHGFSVLALDLPGHGKSSGKPRSSIAAWADWLAAYLADAKLSHVHLVGHSMGALIALETAARHPTLIKAIALLGVAPKMPVHPDLLALADRNDPKAFDLITDWGHGRTGHFGGHRVPGLWHRGGSTRLLAQSHAGALGLDLAACNAYGEGEASAKAVRCKALLVLGTEDRMTPARAGQKLASLISGAEVVLIPGAGHMMMLEAPDETLKALKGLA